MKLNEPTTMLTDWALGVLALALARKLRRAALREDQRAPALWAMAFVALAVASFAGGSRHGFALVLGEAALVALWKLTVWSIGLASLLLLSGVVVSWARGLARRWLLAAALAKFVLYALWMARHDEFRWVIMEYAPTLVVTLGLGLRELVRRRPSGVWIVAGVLVSFGAAGVQLSGLAIHRHFNHNDLYHVVQMMGLVLLYRGGLVLRDA